MSPELAMSLSILTFGVTAFVTVQILKMVDGKKRRIRAMKRRQRLPEEIPKTLVKGEAA